MATVSLNLERHVKASWSRIKAGGASDRESVVMAFERFSALEDVPALVIVLKKLTRRVVDLDARDDKLYTVSAALSRRITSPPIKIYN